MYRPVPDTLPAYTFEIHWVCGDRVAGQSLKHHGDDHENGIRNGVASKSMPLWQHHTI